MGSFLKRVLGFISTSTSSRTVSIVVILIIAAAIPLTVIVSQRQQEIRQQAAKSTSATNLTNGAQTCVNGRVKMSFSWIKSDDYPEFMTIRDLQYWDVSTVDNTFRDGTYLGANVGLSAASYTAQDGAPIGTLDPGKQHWWRINTRYTDGKWHPSSPMAFTTITCDGGGGKQCFAGCYGATSCVNGNRYDMNCDTNTGVCSIQGNLKTPNDPTCGGSTPTPTPTLACSPPNQIFCGGRCQNAGPCPAQGDVLKCRQDTGRAYCAPLNSPTPTLTISPTSGVTGNPSPTSGVTGNPSPTIPQGNTQLKLSLGLDGLGSTGDNENPENSTGSNKDPLRKTRDVTVEVLDVNNTQVAKKSGTVNYDNGKFTGTVDLGSLSSGIYNIKVKSGGYLKKLASVSLQTGTASSQNLFSSNLVTGDMNGDNQINIIDYNILLSCSVFSLDNHGACNQGPDYKTLSDLDDNGTIDQLDYNLFVRELSVQRGD